MASATLQADASVIAVVDIQPSFLAGIHEADRVLGRSEFLIKAGRLLGVPAFATEQYPSRMGGTHERLTPLLQDSPAPMAKMAFSCAGCTEFLDVLEATQRRQVVLVGIETHICVSQTAHDLLQRGFEVIVCADAVGARTLDRHQIGLARIRDAGAVIAHTESMAYEWMATAERPEFRDVLKLVKESA